MESRPFNRHVFGSNYISNNFISRFRTYMTNQNSWREGFDKRIDKLVSEGGFWRTHTGIDPDEMKAFIESVEQDAIERERERIRAALKRLRKGSDFNEIAGEFGGYIDYEQSIEVLSPTQDTSKSE